MIGNNMKILFVDDSDGRYNIFWGSNPGRNIDRASNYDEAIKLLSTNKYDVVYLDHDLSEDPFSITEKTGMDIARHICEHKINIPYIFCHSANPAGRQNMCSILENNNYQVAEFPFSWGYNVMEGLNHHFNIPTTITDEEFKKNIMRMHFDDLSG